MGFFTHPQFFTQYIFVWVLSFIRNKDPPPHTHTYLPTKRTASWWVENFTSAMHINKINCVKWSYKDAIFRERIIRVHLIYISRIILRQNRTKKKRKQIKWCSAVILQRSRISSWHQPIMHQPDWVYQGEKKGRCLCVDEFDLLSLRQEFVNIYFRSYRPKCPES